MYNNSLYTKIERERERETSIYIIERNELCFGNMYI